MKELIRDLRIEIDGLAQLCEELRPLKDGYLLHSRMKGLDLLSIHSTEAEKTAHRARYEKEYNQIIRETSKNTEEIKEAVKSLKLSKAWLGKVLESLGNENPYGSGYKTVEDIVPTADVASRIVDYPVAPDTWPEGEVTKSHIEKVDWLRTEVKSLVQKLNKISIGGYSYKDLETSSKYLTEARFWLGFEMGRIKDESK